MIPVLAVSWALPPMMAPRALQVSRLLDHSGRQGWRAAAVTVADPRDPEVRFDDRRLAAWYAGRYDPILVDPPSRWSEGDPVALLAACCGGARAEARDRAWITAGTRAAAAAVDRLAPRVLVTFAQPWTDHLIGLALKRRFPRLPWVAHFSDPWSDNPYVDAARRTADRVPEHAVIAAADAVIFVNQANADLVMAKYPAAWRTKVRIVPHGIETAFATYAAPACADSGSPAVNRGPVRIAHSGRMFRGRLPFALAEAVTRLPPNADGTPVAALVLIGPIHPDFGRYLRTLRQTDRITFAGEQDYFDSLSQAAGADALVLVDGALAQNVFLPSKLFDYLLVGKPILGLTTPDSGSARLLARLGYPVVPPEDPDAIASALLALAARHREGRLAVAPDHAAVAAEHDAEVTAGLFTRVLAETIARTASPARVATTAANLSATDPAGLSAQIAAAAAVLAPDARLAIRQVTRDCYTVATPEFWTRIAGRYRLGGWATRRLILHRLMADPRLRSESLRLAGLAGAGSVAAWLDQPPAPVPTTDDLITLCTRHGLRLVALDSAPDGVCLHLAHPKAPADRSAPDLARIVQPFGGPDTLDATRPLYLYGAGLGGRRLLDEIDRRPWLQVAAFLDATKTGTIDQLPIMTVQAAVDAGISRTAQILVTSQAYGSILGTLGAFGFTSVILAYPYVLEGLRAVELRW